MEEREFMRMERELKKIGPQADGGCDEWFMMKDWLLIIDYIDHLGWC